MSILDRKGIRALIRSAGTADNPPAGQSLLYPKTDGWYSRASDGTEVKLGGGGGADLATANTWTALQTFQADASGYAARWADSGGVVQATVDNLGVFRSGARRLNPLTSRLTAQAQSTATTYAATGLSLTTATGGVYLIRAVGSYQTAATTTGIGLQFGGTSTILGMRALLQIWGVTATTATQQVQTALAPNAAKTTGVAAANTAYPFTIEGLVRINAGGTFELQFASEVAASAAIIHADSFMTLQEVA